MFILNSSRCGGPGIFDNHTNDYSEYYRVHTNVSKVESSVIIYLSSIVVGVAVQVYFTATQMIIRIIIECLLMFQRWSSVL